MKRAKEVADFAKKYHIDAVIDRKLIGAGQASHEDIQAVIHSDPGEVDKKAERPGKGKNQKTGKPDSARRKTFGRRNGMNLFCVRRKLEQQKSKQKDCSKEKKCL